MTFDAAKLRALAQAATPGPWRLQDGEVLAADDIDCPRGYSPLNRIHTDTDGPDPAFIAAANPLTVIALLDEIESLRKQRDAWMKDSDGWKSAARVQLEHARRAEAHSGHVENQDLAQQLAAMTSARDELADIARTETDDKTHGPIGSYGSKIDRIAELRKVGAR